MIERVNDTTKVTVDGSAAQQRNSGSQRMMHTLFGDLLVDELSSPDIAGLFGGKAPATVADLDAGNTAADSSTSAAPPGEITTAARSAAATVAYAVNLKLSTLDPTTSATSCPSAKSLFGQQVFMTSPSGHGPNATQWSYNPIYFATRHTADVIAKMVGGTVVEQNAICPAGPMVQDQVNEMIQLPNGKMLNAGLVADIFNHGRSQAIVDQMLKEEVAGAYDPSAL